MASRKRVIYQAGATQQTYALLDKQREWNERNDCAVRAIAAAAGVPYERAHDALAQAGRKPRDGVTLQQQLRALAALGCRFQVEYNPRKLGILTYISLHKVKPPGRWLVHTVGHVAAYTAGKLHDYRGEVNRRRKVVSLTRVIRPRRAK